MYTALLDAAAKTGNADKADEAWDGVIGPTEDRVAMIKPVWYHVLTVFC